MFQLPIKTHRNQQLFSDHYLDEILPQHADWQELATEAEPAMTRIADLFAKYTPGAKEAQTEYRLVRPILETLGHTFEVQAPLATPGTAKKPDYVFYRDEAALQANQGKKLTEELLRPGAFAVGDAKYWECPLDVPLKSSDLFTNKNPSYQIAFYIQHSGLDWGILTNGRHWRLYHKQTAHKLDHYYEVDLPALLASGDVLQFLYFYTFFRRAAFDQHPISIGAILQESINYAQGVSNSLKEQVYQALRLLAQGFLDYPPNQLTADNPTTLKAIYDNSLILLYRLLFILYAEARELLPLEKSVLYREYYSLYEVKQRLALHLDADIKHRSNSAKLCCDLKQLFHYINVGDPPLHIATFNGGLFDPERHPFLEQYRISDAHLEQAIDMLARVDGPDGRQFIDYRDLSVRNLGTIYEGLLEYHVEPIEPEGGWTIDLLNDKGERKATGSYYTPDYIVKYITDQTLGPILQSAVENAPDEKAKVDAVLAVKVLDPAMGSAHFLVEATEYIARFLVELNAQAEAATEKADLSYWKRRVVQSCIYGVDINPLAVELAKLSLWLSTVAKDRPLSFLDHHLRTGNALIGAQLSDLTVPTNGNASRKAKKQEAPKEQLSLFNDDVFRQSITTAVDLMWLVKDSPAQTLEQVKEQEQLYATMRQGLIGKYGQLADLTTAIHYGITFDAQLWQPLVDFATGRTAIAPPQFQQWLDDAATIALQRRFFHWELEFPEIFFDKHGQAKGALAGFDAVIGNPPWIRQEAFSEDKPAFSRRYRVYHGVADLSVYFVELGNMLLTQTGRFGFIIPNKFVRANYGITLRKFLSEEVHLERLVDFGDLPVFHDAVTYPMIVLTSKQPVAESQVKYTQLKQFQSSALTIDIESAESLIPRTLLTEAHWSLSGEKTQAIVDKLRSVSTPLGQLVNGNLYRGILTGFNEAFVIDQRTRDKLIATDPKSAEIIKPFVVGRDVKRYALNYKNTYIILSKIGTPIEKYPAIFAYLQRYQSELEARWDKGKHWWELRACDYYDEFGKPKIIYPNICKRPEFAYDTQGYYSNQKTFIIPTDDTYLLVVLNSTVMNFLFGILLPKLRGGFFEPGYVFMKDMPIRRINFTTPPETRAECVREAIARYETGQCDELLDFVAACLASEPEQSDVVHDLLVHLAEQIMYLKKERTEALENFILSLESILPSADMQKLQSKLWSPPTVPQTQTSGKESTKRLSEAQEILRDLYTRPLDINDDIGTISEAQWKWLLKKRLGTPDLVALVKTYRTYQPPITELDKRIAATDRLIDQIVYQLYGLTAEEIAMVEGKDGRS